MVSTLKDTDGKDNAADCQGNTTRQMCTNCMYRLPQSLQFEISRTLIIQELQGGSLTPGGRHWCLGMNDRGASDTGTLDTAFKNTTQSRTIVHRRLGGVVTFAFWVTGCFLFAGQPTHEHMPRQKGLARQA